MADGRPPAHDDAGRRARPRDAVLGWVRAWVPLLVLWLSGCGVLVVLSVSGAAAERADVGGGGEPAVVTVGSREDDGRRAVTVRVVREDPVAVRGQAQGVVTSLVAGPGSVLGTGEVVAEVDGVALLAHRGRAPLHRPVAQGDRGADVEDVGRLLVELGLLDPRHVSTRATSALDAAIRAFQRDRGIERDGVFRPAYVAYAPPGEGAVRRTLVAVGDPVDAGDVLLEIDGQVTGLEIGAAVDGESLAGLGDGTLVLRTRTAEVAVDGLPVPSEQVAHVLDLLDEGIGSGVVTPPSDDDPAHRGVVLALAEPVRRGVVPTTALHGGAGGGLCVVERTTEGDVVHDVHGAAPVAGEIGLSSVPGDLVGRAVVRDPGALDAAVLGQCG